MGRPECLSIEDLPAVGESPESIRYIREPELPEGCVVALTGDSGSGKSTVATAWVRDAIAAGRPASILDRENPRSVVLDRMSRLNLQDGPLLRWAGGWMGTEVPGPDSPLVITWVNKCDQKPIVVVDSLAAFIGGDENDAHVMRTFLDKLRYLANLGASPLIVHHDGKAESARDYRGSSDFKADVDQAFHVTNISSDGKLDRLRLRCFKSRLGLSGTSFYRYAGGRMLRDERIDAPARAVGDQLTDLLRQNPGVGSRRFEDLAVKKALGRQAARDFLANGVVAGTIRRENAGRNRFKHYLSQTE